MSWVYLTHLLEEISNHSTLVGKLWFTFLVVFRIVLTVLGGESIYNDEQGAFVCNTLQPGCENMCYDAFAPLSHARFWVFQIIMITTPTILYLSFALHKISRNGDNNHHSNSPDKHMPPEKKDVSKVVKENDEEDSIIHVEIEPAREKEKKDEAQEKNVGWSHIKQSGQMKVYVIQLCARVLLEVAFVFGQYILYGFKVPAKYVCTIQPCPNTVDCFVSRPTEKTIFLLIMYAVSAICLLLTIFEILYLAVRCIRDAFKTNYQLAKTNTLNLVYVRHTSSPPPGYNMALESAAVECNLGDFSHIDLGDDVSSQELYYQENLKPAKQQLYLVCQSDEGSSVLSSLDVKKPEKQTSFYGKATRV